MCIRDRHPTSGGVKWMYCTWKGDTVMIYFNSDYLEGAHPALMAKLNETNMVQTVGYGEDEYCACLLYTSGQ